ncbi:uncharacterized protein LOC134260096, partial [Saccostrea cucullata]|uniref:uncharacterized protein LOC134260096 n=1 Tax=Saccostrea cuccullata TaxID=36930 RepID=UPI002ED09AD8
MGSGCIVQICLLIINLTISAAQRCPLSARTETIVRQCPKSEENTKTRAQTKACYRLAEEQTCTNSSKFKYHCLPTDLSGTLVEVCAAETYIHGVCVFYNNTELQINESINCSQSSTCPHRFLSSEAHLYEPCQSTILTSTTLTTFKTVTTVPGDVSKLHTSVYILVAVTGIFFFSIGILVFIIMRYTNIQKKNKKEVHEEDIPLRMLEVYDEDDILLGEKGEHKEDKSHLHQTNWVDNYNVWKTYLSEQFSTLTDGEVSVLFCFLCSDSGSPDFTVTEWLDLLNNIRQSVLDKDNPETREEAQQTLDRLRSRDYLWEDQDKMTENTKDETMYRITLKNRYIPFYHSSYHAANMYLRSRGYKRKPEEKCVIGVADYLLIRRLQMNILTHVTMEDTSIYDEIHQILNIPDNMLWDSKNKRKQFLLNLRGEGEAVHYRGRSHDSMDHVRWLWRYGVYARPDIVRSCIGLHPHNDIYIIDNKPYRKPSEHRNNPPDVRCLLYSLLLAEKYQLNLNEQSHRIIRDKIRDRYFPEVAEEGLVNLPDGITKTQNGLIKFTSDDIRHDVMYAFVTECLVDNSDLDFFLTTASRDVISEYCRSWRYRRSEGERCLYVPDEPKKMFDLFIEKLRLDIITHCTVNDKMIHDSISER